MLLPPFSGTNTSPHVLQKRARADGAPVSIKVRSDKKGRSDMAFLLCEESRQKKYQRASSLPPQLDQYSVRNGCDAALDPHTEIKPSSRPCFDSIPPLFHSSSPTVRSSYDETPLFVAVEPPRTNDASESTAKVRTQKKRRNDVAFLLCEEDSRGKCYRRRSGETTFRTEATTSFTSISPLFHPTPSSYPPIDSYSTGIAVSFSNSYFEATTSSSSSSAAAAAAAAAASPRSLLACPSPDTSASSVAVHSTSPTFSQPPLRRHDSSSEISQLQLENQARRLFQDAGLEASIPPFKSYSSPHQQQKRNHGVHQGPFFECPPCNATPPLIATPPLFHPPPSSNPTIDISDNAGTTTTTTVISRAATISSPRPPSSARSNTSSFDGLPPPPLPATNCYPLAPPPPPCSESSSHSPTTTIPLVSGDQSPPSQHLSPRSSSSRSSYYIPPSNNHSRSKKEQTPRPQQHLSGLVSEELWETFCRLDRVLPGSGQKKRPVGLPPILSPGTSPLVVYPYPPALLVGLLPPFLLPPLLYTLPNPLRTPCHYY